MSLEVQSKNLNIYQHCYPFWPKHFYDTVDILGLIDMSRKPFDELFHRKPSSILSICGFIMRSARMYPHSSWKGY